MLLGKECGNKNELLSGGKTMKAEVYTSNCAYENGICVGGYHELHDIRYLSSAEHLIATVKSIIENNLLYGCSDTVLESVEVRCDNEMVVECFRKHFGSPFRYKDVAVYAYLL